MLRLLLLMTCGVATLPAGATGFDGADLNGRRCHVNPSGFGPFDYTDSLAVKANLPIVEQHHFTASVEQLVSGRSGTLVGDLDYTLRAFPNHHRALFAVIRYVTEPGRRKDVGQALYAPPECYLQRALRFQPKDGKVHLLFGLYLHRLGKLPEAEQHYRAAIEQLPNTAEAYYNLGVLLVDQQRFEDAVPMARDAYRLGYPLSGLRKRLAEAGHPLNPEQAP